MKTTSCLEASKRPVGRHQGHAYTHTYIEVDVRQACREFREQRHDQRSNECCTGWPLTIQKEEDQSSVSCLDMSKSTPLKRVDQHGRLAEYLTLGRQVDSEYAIPRTVASTILSYQRVNLWRTSGLSRSFFAELRCTCRRMVRQLLMSELGAVELDRGVGARSYHSTRHHCHGSRSVEELR
jgi:hypothetical protein